MVRNISPVVRMRQALFCAARPAEPVTIDTKVLPIAIHMWR